MKRLIFFLISALVMAVPILAQQSLPASTWYAVAYAPDTDTLHWINAQGEQAQSARPHLTDETALIDLRIAPNGRTLVMGVRLNSGLEALGIYDIETGALLNTHIAQMGEHLNMGGNTIFTTNSQYFAVGLWSGDFAAPAWRVILFETVSGNPVAFIDHTHPDAPQMPLSAPSVQVLDGTYVHFQLIPQSVIGGDSFPTFAWRVVGFDPQMPVLAESPLNAGTPALPILPIEYSDSYAAADGMLFLSTEHVLYYLSNADPGSLVQVVELSSTIRMVYVTPVGATFDLAALPNTDTPPVPQVVVPQIVPPQQVTAAPCASALTPRVFVGGMGRVMMSTPTLNVRAQAGGAIVTAFSAGTTFFVTGGSACVQDLIWWQIERFGTVGWVAESLGGNYLIEPYNGPMSADPTPSPTPDVAQPAVPVCGDALPPRLSVGSGAVMVDTVNAFNGPGGSQIALRWYESGTPVTVNAGPECVGGQWWWLITGSAKVGRIGNNYESLQAWVQETEPGAYNLSP